MPTQPCPDCGREVSTAAEACPQCGRPLARNLVKAAGTKEGPFLQTLNCGCIVVLVLIALIVGAIIIAALFGPSK